jgi:eukaryotic-like serine/threonine-protein kinase
MYKQLAAFVENIRRSDLLGPEKVDQIAAWAGATEADPQAIAKDIVQRGWLTAFQVKLFWKGRGDELFLNQYVLMDRLGEGGMGEVFKARHRRMERDVALKVIRNEKLGSAEAIKRFHQEIMTAAALAHENVVMAYDADQAGDRHFFAMEYVEGTNLTRLVKEKGPMPIAQACDCVRQAALGLQHACERGMVHRDIKPSNLLLGKGGIVKILDMGLARLQESPSGDEQSRITQEGLAIGTPDFLAPEQARNARTVDIRADIYSLGCSFYYLLCGHTPYQGGTPTEKMLRHTTDPIPALTRPGVPPQVEDIVYKMMAKKPDDRFQMPAEVAFALQSFSGIVPIGSSELHRLPPDNPPLSELQPKYMRTSAPADDDDHRTESRFRLPPPRPPRKPVPERTRWNVPIAMATGVVVLVIAAVSIYLLLRKGKEPVEQSLDQEFRNAHEMQFVLIPRGSFEMGSPDNEAGRGPDEGPVHPVEIARSFYLGTTEVTLKQFQSVTGRLPEAFVRLKLTPEELDVPATMISHFEAVSFCRKLNADAGSKKDGWEYRLPTEAEWEYACRAGSKSRYAFGAKLSQKQALFGDSSAKSPGQVAQFPANAWGLYDMHGNAAEWVADMYDRNYYQDSPSRDPTGPTGRSQYVIRGGGFNDSADACRSAHRVGRYPELVKDATSMRSIGFRVAFAPTSKE